MAEQNVDPRLVENALRNPGSLDNTLSGQAVSPTGQAGQVPPEVAPPPVTPPTSGNTGQSNQFALSQAMSALESKVKSNNALMTQRNLLLKHLYDQPLTSEEQAQLDPTFLKDVQSNDKNQIDMSLRLISDEIAGRTGTLDQSVQYLTQAYNQDIQNTQTAKQNALAQVNSFINYYGDQAGDMLTKLYGPEYTKQLADMGINVKELNAPTVNQTRYTGAGGVSISIPTGTLAARNNNPGNIRFIGQAGATQGEGGFAAFATPEAGFQALVDDIAFKQSGESKNTIPDGPNAGKPLNGSTTLEDMIRIYAPTGDNNDPVGYAASVAAKLGVSPATPISEIDPQDLAIEMAKHESGTDVALPDSQTVAKGIENGTLPPVLTGLYSKKLGVEAQLKRDGFNLAQATTEWNATQKFISTLNSTQQVRLRQAISSVSGAIGNLRKASNDWNAGGFGPFNAARLKLALSGSLGQDAQAIAATFMQQSTIIQDELGQVFMGGTSPTDKALGLAAQTFNTDWSNETMQKALTNLEQNLQYRQNAIDNSAPAGIGGSNTYLPDTSGSTGGGSSADDILKQFGVTATGSTGGTVGSPTSQPNIFQRALTGLGKFFTGQ